MNVEILNIEYRYKFTGIECYKCSGSILHSSNSCSSSFTGYQGAFSRPQESPSHALSFGPGRPHTALYVRRSRIFNRKLQPGFRKPLPSLATRNHVVSHRRNSKQSCHKEFKSVMLSSVVSTIRCSGDDRTQRQWVIRSSMRAFPLSGGDTCSPHAICKLFWS